MELSFQTIKPEYLIYFLSRFWLIEIHLNQFEPKSLQFEFSFSWTFLILSYCSYQSYTHSSYCHLAKRSNRMLINASANSRISLCLTFKASRMFLSNFHPSLSIFQQFFSEHLNGLSQDTFDIFPFTILTWSN